MKRIISVLIILSLSVLLFACGNNTTNESTTNSNISVTEIATKLFENLQFDDELESFDNATKTLATYGIEESNVEVARYVGSGATAEEIAVFKCQESTAVKEIENAIQNRITYLHDGYSDYGPEQVPEIDSAVVSTNGNIVVFVICNNPEAVEGIIKDLL